MKEKIFSVEKEITPVSELGKGSIEKIKKAEEELELLTRIVGCDFGMTAKFGKPGSGNFFDPENISIIFDPNIISEGKEWMAEFIAGHEGGHRAITRSLEQLGVQREKAMEIYKQIGFGYLDNCVEDCADNDWVSDVFEKFRESSGKMYEEQFQQENAQMVTPEISKIISMLGYTPKFVSFGSEVIRKWATGKYSGNLDRNVKESLEKTENDFTKAWEQIPGKYSKEKERINKARERFKIIYEKVWPEFEKLVKMDIDQEKMRQLANEMLKDMKRQQTDEERQENLDASSLPEELQKELDKLSEENLKEQLEKLEKELDKLHKELKQPDLSEEQKKEIEDKIKQLTKDKKDLKSGNKNTVPWNKLPEELKQKIKDIYNKLPKSIREELDKKAREILEELDDKLIEEGRDKLSEDDRPLTHKEIKELETAEQESMDKEIKQEKESKKAEKEIKQEIEAALSEYDKIYQEVAPVVDELYQRIHKIFLPQRHPRWQKGFPQGHRLNLLKVMQFQTDKGLYDKLWERKTIPKKIDYRFTLLVDLSGSMQGETIDETFRGLLVMAETLNRLGIKIEILGFQDELIEYLNFEQSMNPMIRQKLLNMKKEVYDSGEHNQSSWNSDGYCLSQASERLQKNKGKDNFIIVFSDGEPVPDPEHSGAEFELKKVAENIQKKSRQKLIGVGLGPDTEHVKDFYPTSLPSLNLKDMPRLLGELLEDMIKHPSRYV